jgi:hypothetical protein
VASRIRAKWPFLLPGRCDNLHTVRVDRRGVRSAPVANDGRAVMHVNAGRIFTSLVGLTLGVVAGDRAQAQDGAAKPAASFAQASADRDGQHDFDFEIGTWKTHVKRLLHPLTGSTTWTEYDGTSVVSKVLDGRANLVELRMDGAAGHFEGISLRLYNPQSHQWSLNFSNAGAGTLSQPTIGEFRDGRGEFYDQETLNERAILVRFVITPVDKDQIRFEQSFSADGGKTWEPNWVATDTRVTAKN